MEAQMQLIDLLKKLFNAIGVLKMTPLIIAVIVGILGLVSVKYLGDGNIFEKEAEVIIEEELHLPAGAIDLEKFDS